MMMIGDRIKQARLALGYSAEQVAAYLKVSPATIYRYENGDISKLPTKHLKPLADFLCVTPEYIMGWSTDSSLPERPDDDIHTPEARILAKGIDKLPQEQREQALAVVRAMFVKYADYFGKDEDNDP